MLQLSTHWKYVAKMLLLFFSWMQVNNRLNVLILILNWISCLKCEQCIIQFTMEFLHNKTNIIHLPMKVNFALNKPSRSESDRFGLAIIIDFCKLQCQNDQDVEFYSNSLDAFTSDEILKGSIGCMVIYT